MQVWIRLLATYRRYVPAGYEAEGIYPVEAAPGTRVADLLAALPIPPTDSFTFFVNGRHGERDQVLHEGDVVSIFPAAGGG